MRNQLGENFKEALFLTQQIDLLISLSFMSPDKQKEGILQILTLDIRKRGIKIIFSGRVFCLFLFVFVLFLLRQRGCLT